MHNPDSGTAFIPLAEPYAAPQNGIIWIPETDVIGITPDPIV